MISTSSVVYIVVVAGCLLAYCSVRFLRMPPSFGALHLAAILVLAASLLLHAFGHAPLLLGRYAFSQQLGTFLLSVTLPLWLFASIFAGQVYSSRDVGRSGLLTITTISVGTMFGVAALVHVLTAWFRWQDSWWICLAFAAAVSIPDPRASSDFVRYGTKREQSSQIVGFLSSMKAVLMLSALTGVLGLFHRHGSFGEWLLLGSIASGGALALGYVSARVIFLLLRRAPGQTVLLTLALATGGVTLANLLHLPVSLASAMAALTLRRLMRHSPLPENDGLSGPLFWRFLDLIWSSSVVVALAILALSLSFSWPAVAIGSGAWALYTALQALSFSRMSLPLSECVKVAGEGLVPGILLLSAASAAAVRIGSQWFLPAAYVFVLLSTFWRARSPRALSRATKLQPLSA